MNQSTIYLDHGASTPVHPDVVAAMIPYWTTHYGNPSSSHAYGQAAGDGLEAARHTLADLLQVKATELIFTGCGSESDNLALRGVMFQAREQGQGNHLITSCIEHEAVLETAVQLRDQFGFDLTILPVDRYGRVSVADVQTAIQPDTVLISIMAANNEVGSWQPFLEIGELAHQAGVLFHTDAIQAIALRRWQLHQMPIDLLSIAPHKFYGPKGVGVLYVRQGVPLTSALTGGGQEEGRRSGTVNVPFAVGSAKALALAMEELETRVAHYTQLRDRLIEGMLTAVSPDLIQLTGHPTDRLPHHASFAFKHLSGNDLLMHLDMAGIAASSGSACKTGNPKPSAILQAMGLSDEWASGGLRLTVGTQTSQADIDFVLEKIPPIIDRLQKMNQLLRV